MANPQSSFTTFDFYCDSFEELPYKLKEEVGYQVTPNNIWSINIEVYNITQLHVTLTILYWKEK